MVAQVLYLAEFHPSGISSPWIPHLPPHPSSSVAENGSALWVWGAFLGWHQGLGFECELSHGFTDTNLSYGEGSECLSQNAGRHDTVKFTVLPSLEVVVISCLIDGL